MEKSSIAGYTGGGGKKPQGRQGFWPKIPFFKFLSNSKFSVSNVNKSNVGVETPTYIKNYDVRIWKKSVNNFSCHPELVSGSDCCQECSDICTQKSNVGQVCPTGNNILLNTEERSIIDKVGWAFSPTMKLCWGRNPNLQKAISYASRTATRHVRGDLVPKVAFTLAEVLITLGIIGVVAAMTLPTLMANYQKQETISKLQKVYTILNQALKLSEVDNGESEYWEINSFDPQTYFEKYWEPYFKIAKICNTYQECGFTSVTPYTFTNGSKSTTRIVYPNNRVTFITPDGVLIAASSVSGGETLEDGTVVPINTDLHFFVDINGSNRPNQYGKDFFMFRVDTTKRCVIPTGKDYTYNEINSNCSKTGDGRYCLAKIVRDGWKIKDDYPW